MSHCLHCGLKLGFIGRLRSGQYCSAECKAAAKEQEDRLAVESLSLFGTRSRGDAPVDKPKRKETRKDKHAETPDPDPADFVKQPVPLFADRSAGICITPCDPIFEFQDEDEQTNWHALVPPLLPRPACRARFAGTPLAAIAEPGFAACATTDCLVVDCEAMPLDAQPAPDPGALPRLHVDLGPLEALALEEEETSAETVHAGPPKPPPAALQPPPRPPPSKPQVDAHRIASAFPAMMQAGLVRVEPGFASVVIELRPVSAPVPRSVESEPVDTGLPAVPPDRRCHLPSELETAHLCHPGASACQGPFPLLAPDTSAETVPINPLRPGSPKRLKAANRAKPDVRVPVRLLPMRHFSLPAPVAEWSQ